MPSYSQINSLLGKELEYLCVKHLAPAKSVKVVKWSRSSLDSQGFTPLCTSISIDQDSIRASLTPQSYINTGRSYASTTQIGTSCRPGQKAKYCTSATRSLKWHSRKCSQVSLRYSITDLELLLSMADSCRFPGTLSHKHPLWFFSFPHYSCQESPPHKHTEKLDLTLSSMCWSQNHTGSMEQVPLHVLVSQRVQAENG